MSVRDHAARMFLGLTVSVVLGLIGQGCSRSMTAEESNPERGTLESVDFAILKAIGSSNREVERASASAPDAETLSVVFAANDNVTDSMIKRGLMRDVRNVLQVVAESGYESNAIVITGTFPIGGEDVNVIRAVVSVDKLAATDWEAFTMDDVEGVADMWWIHPRMKAAK